ncbi:CAP domain-containing protein [Neolewinella agarilytica]|uniref:Uncharacterized conserved protein YkwD, contains CAP (CSP/antigen 5/PR1) domain n=1 Tax=Neolewinella agarilytica TaxID=478744 RepID=A0A1H9ME14_9BACT|nr:CAP domain-containing protein [Neolewinella agarilytica]SER21884.1 Uncharacterized conserved protein YkwD, contains CAP (CSP/antigen 5/PR1) domain [Neolewinella agarilytica]
MRIIAFLLLTSTLFYSCQTDIATGDSLNESDPITSSDDAPPTTAENAMATLALSLVNQQRVAGCTCGSTEMPPVAALRLNNQLTAAAQAHADDMAGMGKMQHTGSDGSSVATRVTRAGFDWTAVAENIAWNQRSVEAVVNAWINSEGHCKNLMNERYQFMGFGETDWYWAQVFAR